MYQQPYMYPPSSMVMVQQPMQPTQQQPYYGSPQPKSTDTYGMPPQQANVPQQYGQQPQTQMQHRQPADSFANHQLPQNMIQPNHPQENIWRSQRLPQQESHAHQSMPQQQPQHFQQPQHQINSQPDQYHSPSMPPKHQHSHMSNQHQPQISPHSHQSPIISQQHQQSGMFPQRHQMSQEFSQHYQHPSLPPQHQQGVPIHSSEEQQRHVLPTEHPPLPPQEHQHNQPPLPIQPPLPEKPPQSDKRYQPPLPSNRSVESPRLDQQRPVSTSQHQPTTQDIKQVQNSWYNSQHLKTSETITPATSNADGVYTQYQNEPISNQNNSSDETKQWMHESKSSKPPPPPPSTPPNKQSASSSNKSMSTSNNKSKKSLSGQSKSQPKDSLPAASKVEGDGKIEDETESLESLNQQLETLESQIKTYQDEYQKWHRDFVKWQKQHQNHPDQKQYVDYQKQYQKLIEEQQSQLKAQYTELQKKIAKRKAERKKAVASKPPAPVLPVKTPKEKEEPKVVPPPPLSDKDIDNLKTLAAHAQKLQVLQDLGDIKKKEDKMHVGAQPQELNTPKSQPVNMPSTSTAPNSVSPAQANIPPHSIHNDANQQYGFRDSDLQYQGQVPSSQYDPSTSKSSDITQRSVPPYDQPHYQQQDEENKQQYQNFEVGTPSRHLDRDSSRYIEGDPHKYSEQEPPRHYVHDPPRHPEQGSPRHSEQDYLRPPEQDPSRQPEHNPRRHPDGDLHRHPGLDSRGYFGHDANRYADYDPTRHSEGVPPRHLERDPARHPAHDPTGHLERNQLPRHPEYDPPRHLERDPPRRLERNLARHPEGDPTRHLEPDRTRHSEHDPIRHPEDDPARHLARDLPMRPEFDSSRLPEHDPPRRSEHDVPRHSEPNQIRHPEHDAMRHFERDPSRNSDIHIPSEARKQDISSEIRREQLAPNDRLGEIEHRRQYDSHRQFTDRHAPPHHNDWYAPRKHQHIPEKDRQEVPPKQNEPKKSLEYDGQHDLPVSREGLVAHDRFPQHSSLERSRLYGPPEIPPRHQLPEHSEKDEPHVPYSQHGPPDPRDRYRLQENNLEHDSPKRAVGHRQLDSMGGGGPLEHSEHSVRREINMHNAPSEYNDQHKLDDHFPQNIPNVHRERLALEKRNQKHDLPERSDQYKPVEDYPPYPPSERRDKLTPQEISQLRNLPEGIKRLDPAERIRQRSTSEERLERYRTQEKEKPHIPLERNERLPPLDRSHPRGLRENIDRYDPYDRYLQRGQHERRIEIDRHLRNRREGPPERRVEYSPYERDGRNTRRDQDGPDRRSESYRQPDFHEHNDHPEHFDERKQRIGRRPPPDLEGRHKPQRPRPEPVSQKKKIDRGIRSTQEPEKDMKKENREENLQDKKIPTSEEEIVMPPGIVRTEDKQVDTSKSTTEPAEVEPVELFKRASNEYAGSKCKFFPKCRNGRKCKFDHPVCTEKKSCTNSECAFEHAVDRVIDMSAIEKAESDAAKAEASKESTAQSGKEEASTSKPDGESSGAEKTAKSLPVMATMTFLLGNETIQKAIKETVPDSQDAVSESLKENIETDYRRKRNLSKDTSEKDKTETPSKLSKPEESKQETPTSRSAAIQARIDEIFEKRKKEAQSAHPPEKKKAETPSSQLEQTKVAKNPPSSESSKTQSDSIPQSDGISGKAPQRQKGPEHKIGSSLDNDAEEYERRKREILGPHHSKRDRLPPGIVIHPDDDLLPPPRRPVEDRGFPEYDRERLARYPNERNLDIIHRERYLRRSRSPPRDERGRDYPPLRYDRYEGREPDIPPYERVPRLPPRDPLYDDYRKDPLDKRVIDYGHRSSRDPYLDRRPEDPYLERREPYERGYPSRYPGESIRERDPYIDDRRKSDPYLRGRDRYDDLPYEERRRLDEERRRLDPPRRERDDLDRRERSRDPPVDRYDRGRDLSPDPYARRRAPESRDRYPEPLPPRDGRGSPYDRDRDPAHSRASDYRKSRSDDRGYAREKDLRERDRPPRGEDRRRHERPRESKVPEIELKPEVFSAADIIEMPGRKTRPKNVVIILRGIPGSGKSFMAKLIRDREAHHGAQPPRILALDDYFMQEVKNKETGKMEPTYVFEKDMEAAYRGSLLKAFNKTLTDGFFPMVIVDAINDKNKHFDQFWSDAKHKGFEVYIADVKEEFSICFERMVHKKPREVIEEMMKYWEEPPVYYKRLDVRSLLQDAAIDDVEMEEAPLVVPTSQDNLIIPINLKDTSNMDDDDEDELPSTFHIPRSKWESSNKETLAKLDGITKRKPKTDKKQDSPIFDDEEDDPYGEKEADMRLGKKRVRWLDLEEKKQLDHQRKIGFTIGMDWKILTDPHAKIPK